MHQSIALIPVDLQSSRLGLRCRVGETVAGRTVLAHTVARVAQMSSIRHIVLVHPQGQDPLPLIDGVTLPKPVETFADAEGLADRFTACWRIARRWAPTAWRGGLGGATVFDELLPPGPLLAAMQAHDAESALLVGGDWCLVDPALCDAVLQRHLEAPQDMKLTFSQAPPGLCGVATNIHVLRDLHEHHAGFAHILGYNPRAPIGDPIGREVNIAIPPQVRDIGRRLIFDTPRSAALIGAIIQAEPDADAAAVARLSAQHDSPDALPAWVTLELTPRREVAGPITPQHHATFDRPDLDLDLARRLVAQLGEVEDACLMLGGLGDAVLHPHWLAIAEAAKAAGVASVGVETDLLCGEDDLQPLLSGSIDVISVRLNADTAATYQRVMGADRFATVIGNLEWLINQRNRRSSPGAGGMAQLTGVPWIVPRLIKTRDTLADLESFFDKWMIYAGHAVIEPAPCGCGTMPDLSPTPMAPPRRTPCQQLQRRMTILSDGVVAQCDQDWHGQASLGDAKLAALADIWAAAASRTAAHAAGRFADLTLCGTCTAWHRP